MSDDLSPAEQARAARWAKDWLTDGGFDVSETARDAMSALGCHADKLDPPESVESLRAERDDARGELRYVRESFAQLNGNFEAVCGERDEAREKLAHAEWVITDFQTANRVVREERDEALRANQRFEGEQEELVQALNKLSAANYTIAHLRATHEEQMEDMKARWLKDARERSTDLFLAKNPLPSSEAARGRCSRED